jgi:hypothetical protein
MIVLAHITAVGSLAFMVPLVTVIVLMARREGDRSEAGRERRRRARAHRATVRERWLIERRGEGWVLVGVEMDEDPAVKTVPSPWASAAAAPTHNGNGHAPDGVRDLVAGLARPRGDD